MKFLRGLLLVVKGLLIIICGIGILSVLGFSELRDYSNDVESREMFGNLILYGLIAFLASAFSLFLLGER